MFVKPITTATSHVLPFERLSPDNFERLVLWLIDAEGFDDAQHLGLLGGDGGRDIVAVSKSSGETWVFQAKRIRNASFKIFQDEIDKLRQYYDTQDGNSHPQVVNFATACAVNARIRDRVLRYGKQHGFQIDFWAETELDQKLKKHPAIVAEFFHIPDFALPLLHSTSAGINWVSYCTQILTELNSVQTKEYVDLRKFDATNSKKKVAEKSGLQSLDEFIDEWLSDSNRPHLALLGEYGSGKTSYCRRLASRLAKSLVHGADRARAPVLIYLRDFSDARDVEGILDNFWDLHGRGSRDAFRQAIHQGKTVLILDGFDEMQPDLREVTANDNFASLRRLFTLNSKVLITSRRTLFLNDSEERSVMQVPHSRLRDTSLVPQANAEQIPRAYIDEFSKADILEYMILRHGEAGSHFFRLMENTYNLLELASRPILADIIARTIPSLTERSIVWSSELYETYVSAWINREAWRLTSTDMVGTILEEIAITYLASADRTVSDAIVVAAITKFINSGNLSLSQIISFERNLKLCTFLTRDHFGSWRFTHLSFAEYFAAKRAFRLFDGGDYLSDASFPFSDANHNQLRGFVSPLLKIDQQGGQGGWHMFSQITQTGSFFAEMLVRNELGPIFVEFIFAKRATVWGYMYLSGSKILWEKIPAHTRERLHSDFEWNYYLSNVGWYGKQLDPPKSTCRIEYADKP